MRLFGILLGILYCGLLQAQSSYPVSTIPVSLVSNSNAVVREDVIDVEIKSFDLAEVKIKHVVTVFNKLGDSEIINYIHFSPAKKIRKISAVVYDASGTEIKKFRKKDFSEVSAVSSGGIYSDSKIMYTSYVANSYPYTFEFEVEYTTQNTAFIPRWRPMNSFHVSVENSTYKIRNPQQIPYDFKTYNFEKFNINSPVHTDTEFLIEAQNIPAIVYEFYHPGILQLIPRSVFALKKINLFQNSTQLNDWDDFAKWHNESLLYGRNTLPSKTVQEISYLVQDTESTLEKVRRIYEYVQQKTRYISVQIGIGGWQPSSAEEVDRLSYGDCKGLTNYTKALLESQGIPSYYTIVYRDHSIHDIDTDIVTLQGNHAILTVPIEGEDYFLECTSTLAPLGFVGEGTDNRTVVIITPEGGKIAKTRKYTTEENLTQTQASVTLKPDGSISAQVTVKTHGYPYGNLLELDRASEKEIQEYYRNKWGYLHHLKLNQINHQNDKYTIQYHQELHLESSNYGLFNGEDLIFSPNVFNRYESAPVRYTDRQHPVRIMRGYTFVDSVDFIIPEGYQVSHIPQEISLNTPFGSYQTRYTLSNNTLVYHRTFITHEGDFQPNQYHDLREFYREVVKNDSNKIVLTKTN